MSGWVVRPLAGQWQGADAELDLSAALPQIALRHAALYEASADASPQQIAAYLKQHPAILGLDKKIDASEAGVELAEQKYRPQWSVNASYGYREDDPVFNDDRADFFSVGVAFDLPLFTSKRQDQTSAVRYCQRRGNSGLKNGWRCAI